MIDKAIEQALVDYVKPEDMRAAVFNLKNALKKSIPKPVEMAGKYESLDGGVHVLLNGNPEWDKKQLNYLGQYAEDQGWNRYYINLRSSIDGMELASLDFDYKIDLRE